MTNTIEETIDRVLSGVNSFSAPGPGFTRPSYSPLETAAHAFVENEAARLGLQVTRDKALNLYARLPGRDRDATPIFMGSHVDSVPSGGAYDGVAGVAGALALAADFVARGEVPEADLVVAVIRAEESVWFPSSYIGSRAATGKLRSEDLTICRADTGRSLADHIRDEGGNPDAALAYKGLPPARFVELHIEQGPVLDKAGESFAIVSGIRGGLRYRSARIDGVWAHSGGAPREDRSDAVFALADLITALDRRWDTASREAKDIAVTFGRIDAASKDHAFAKVPGRVDFCIDLRSAKDETLNLFDDFLKQEMRAIEERRGVRFDLGAQTRSLPSSMSSTMIRQLTNAAMSLGSNPRTMFSGGGHDAAAFASSGWDAAMLFVRNWNGSHNPDEGMSAADLEEAVRVIKSAIS